MLTLDTDERDRALSTLHSCGVEGEDAHTALDVVLRLTTAPSLDTLAAAHRDATPQALSGVYGSDASRVALVLSKHLRPASSPPS